MPLPRYLRDLPESRTTPSKAIPPRTNGELKTDGAVVVAGIVDTYGRSGVPDDPPLAFWNDDPLDAAGIDTGAIDDASGTVDGFVSVGPGTSGACGAGAGAGVGGKTGITCGGSNGPGVAPGVPGVTDTGGA